MEESSDDPRTYLDSHANMVVLGSNFFVFESTGRIFNVQPFTSDLGIAKNVSIVDGSLAHDCPCIAEVYALVIINALYVPSIDHVLMPPFIMRYSGTTINDVPNVHWEGPIVECHRIYFKYSSL